MSNWYSGYIAGFLADQHFDVMLFAKDAIFHPKTNTDEQPLKRYESEPGPTNRKVSAGPPIKESETPPISKNYKGMTANGCKSVYERHVTTVSNNKAHKLCNCCL